MHFTSADREQVMLALGKAIGLLDQVAALDPELDFMSIRRQLVNAYLDVLAERLRPYDQLMEASPPPLDSLADRSARGRQQEASGAAAAVDPET